MNTYRRLLADAIERNGGYNSWCRRWVALSWNVKLRGDVRTQFDELLPEAAELVDLRDLTQAAHEKAQARWRELLVEDLLWSDVMMAVRYRVCEDDIWKTFSPKVGIRYGLPELTPPFEVGFEFQGRNGGHLCITRFEGLNLYGSSKELAASIRTGRIGTNQWCQKLLCMIHEWDLCFTHEAAREEVQAEFAWRLSQVLEQTMEQERLLDLHMKGL